MAGTAQDAVVLRFGAFEINLQSEELRKSGIRLRLAGQPFQILAELVARAGQVVTREELHAKLWPADTFVDFDHGLNNAVARIREVLEDSSAAPRYVETIPRRGYRFIAPLTNVRPTTGSPVTADPEVRAPQESAAPGAVEPARLLLPKRFALNRLTVALTIAAVIAGAALSFVLYRRGVTGAGHPAIRSLAVLPLKNLSGDPTQEYLADGMTEELIGRLAGIHDLRVISRT